MDSRIIVVIIAVIILVGVYYYYYAKPDVAPDTPTSNNAANSAAASVPGSDTPSAPIKYPTGNFAPLPTTGICLTAKGERPNGIVIAATQSSCEDQCKNDKNCLGYSFTGTNHCMLLGNSPSYNTAYTSKYTGAPLASGPVSSLLKTDQHSTWQCYVKQ